jgi:twitching motility protein PilJ
MALSLKTLFGAGPAKGQEEDNAEIDEPTTQVKMGKQQTGYDPLAAVSIMEQMRAASPEMRQPGRLWIIGHLPIVRQFQVLGVLLVVFVLLALVMLFLNTRVSTQATASGTTATEMQMLSQRLARGTSLAVQGNVTAFEGVKDSRDRFRTDLDALTKGGNVKGVNVDVSSNETLQSLLNDVTKRWTAVEKNATDVVDNQPSLVALSKGLDTINKGNSELLELAQQASAQVAAGGGT